ncbi:MULTISPECIES: class I SAM-dependent methyltransferase [Streptomyces]|uniref:Class I SAM-dependent methyltransferase n=1 Tax=Streptomyces drozdowiczii TaxID=202862 RepID=A0ABY6PZV7_9ACTN|nr:MULTISPECIES: class I SAM-dependent methyltransferase [Streptomyces]MCX0242540.1 class I SAM-dependent methyltransferase [Streptomyces drozdowiczii]OKJ70005.1 oxin biosynthesis protein [Streptomyces sp. CB02460]UZK57421.1 class I SAM-dependent methyltransferase [Streptomyces drozdowiczii]
MITEANQNLARVRDYYTAQRSTGGEEESIYAIWEKGGAYNDSVTPSTYVPEYRSHMALKLLSLTEEGASVFSLGCGNAAVEGVVVGLGRTVRGIDFNEEAVRLARQKGVDAFAADYYALRAADVAGTDIVYADGFLGHLFDAEHETGPALDQLATLGLKSGAHLVFSNDAPQDREARFAPHQRVEDFWYLSKDYLAERLEDRGYRAVESYYFPYLRPVSGMRNRTICIARVP